MCVYVCVYIVFGIRGKREKKRERERETLYFYRLVDRGEEKQVEKHNCVVWAERKRREENGNCVNMTFPCLVGIIRKKKKKKREWGNEHPSRLTFLICPNCTKMRGKPSKKSATFGGLPLIKFKISILSIIKKNHLDFIWSI